MTLTGGRPEAFRLCETWISASIRQPDFWTVVDDVDPETEVTLGQRVIRPEPRWAPGQRTLARNLQAALEVAQGDVIVIVEDDDHYSPGWLSAVSDHFTYNPESFLFGEGWTIYYNLRTRKWYQNSNDAHASLCATAFRRELVGPILELLADWPPGNPFVDHLIWTELGERGTLVDSNHVLGIKGLPGRMGCGASHSPRHSESWPFHDAGFNYLKHLVGEEDCRRYQCLNLPLAPSNAMPPNMIKAGQCSPN